MFCPRSQCNSSNLRTHHTFNHDNPALKQAYKGLNIMRRQKHCLNCGFKFFSLEILETEYDKFYMYGSDQRDTTGRIRR